MPRIRIGIPVLVKGRGAGLAWPRAQQLCLAVVLCLVVWALVSCALAPAPTVPANPLPPTTRAPAVAPAPTATVLYAPQVSPGPTKPQASQIPAVDSEWLIIVHRSQQQIVLYRGGQEQKTYTVSTGKPETITPLGWWKVVEKYPVDPPGIYGTRWLGWQRWNPRSGRYEWYKESPPFGIHGTNEPEKIGTAVSSGCVRLQNRDVEEVYDLIPVGTYVLVVE